MLYLDAERPFGSSREPRLCGQPKTREETALQMAHHNPSDSSSMTMNADPGLSRGQSGAPIRGASEQGRRPRRGCS